MREVILGIIREGKVPPDKRVPLTPKQCKQVEAKFPNVKVIVQPSQVRAYKDEDYIAEGITVQEDLSFCDLIAGVKEVNIGDLIPNKKFMFFSHTFKKQPYNRNLLKAILDNKIQLIQKTVARNNGKLSTKIKTKLDLLEKDKMNQEGLKEIFSTYTGDKLFTTDIPTLMAIRGRGGAKRLNKASLLMKL